MIELAVGIEILERRNVIALTLSAGVDLLGLLQARQSTLDRLRVRMPPELVPRTHALAPVRHRALRVLLLDSLKRLGGFLVPERMKQCDALLEILLRVRRAGNGKMYSPKLLRCKFLVMIAVVSSHDHAT